MTIQEQLNILQQGAKEWNTWRKQNREVRIDLSGANLTGAALSGANLTGAALTGANLTGANLTGANLSDADLRSADLRDANLNDANLSGANLIRADLSDAHLSRADLSDAHLSDAHLSRAHLRGAQFSRADLNGANLNRTHLRGADLSYANLSRAIFSHANLSYAHLRGADLSYADFSYTDLNYANLSDTSIRDSSLSGASLVGADLTGASLNGIGLSDADLSRVSVGETVFGSLDLRTVKGLETINHRAPSTIGTDTLERSQGNIPDIFLKGAGLSNTFIIYARSLVQSPIEYYTCFISYSSKDEAFAKRLHNDLQQEGVRCWFAPDDMDVGDKIRHRIEESIRLYDKLLLVLSEHSIASTWVEYEVEQAVNKEPQGTPNVLYPVRVDTAIMTCTKTWAHAIRSTRHIGDFENWTDPQQYEENFKRLLRALNTKKEQLKK